VVDEGLGIKVASRRAGESNGVMRALPITIGKARLTHM